MATAALPWILGGASFLGGLFGKPQSSSTSSRSSTSGSNVTTPTWDPSMSPLMGLTNRLVMERMRNGGADITNLTNTRLSGINQLFNNIGQSQKSRLAASGMMNAGANNPLVASAGINLEQARGGEMAKILAEEPLLKDQLDRQGLDQAMALLGLTRGSTSNFTSNQTSSSNTRGSSGGGLGGGLEGLGGILGWLYGMGKIG